ncbi:MAG: hypothetical protein NPIRA06_15740 [Nitrospirales bacterium]|nr:MAG: hypothetical protein NPIRA06_15740 [Nitrospirales bacterium]
MMANVLVLHQYHYYTGGEVCGQDKGIDQIRFVRGSFVRQNVTLVGVHLQISDSDSVWLVNRLQAAGPRPLFYSTQEAINRQSQYRCG